MPKETLLTTLSMAESDLERMESLTGFPATEAVILALRAAIDDLVAAASKPKFTIITGNPVDGFELYGLFEDESAASEHANHDADLPESWWTMEIHPLEEEGDDNAHE